MLDITLLEIEIQAILSSTEFERVERLGLSFRDGRDARRVWKFAVACEEAAEVLDDKLLLLVDVEDRS